VKTKILLPVSAIITASLLTGCASRPAEQRGTNPNHPGPAVGYAVGGVVGAVTGTVTGAVASTPSYQDALRRLYEARQVYKHADHKDGHVTARSLAALPIFYAKNLTDFTLGAIAEEKLESNASIYDRYVASLPESRRTAAEDCRVTVIGKPSHHRAKHGAEEVHDPMHMLFLVPGAGAHPGIPGNYLHGAVFHVGPDEVAGAWVIHVHDGDDGISAFKAPTLALVLAHLQDVLASAPFHLDELEALGFESL